MVSKMKISSELFNLLICPVSKKKLEYDYYTHQLISAEAELAYPIIDGIPIMLADQAKKISKKETKKYLKSK